MPNIDGGYKLISIGATDTKLFCGVACQCTMSKIYEKIGGHSLIVLVRVDREDEEVLNECISRRHVWKQKEYALEQQVKDLEQKGHVLEQRVKDLEGELARSTGNASRLSARLRRMRFWRRLELEGRLLPHHAWVVQVHPQQVSKVAGRCFASKVREKEN